MSNHNGMEFSTSDSDNDGWSSGDCAGYYGANWWDKCGNNINGGYGGVCDVGDEFMRWSGFNNKNTALKSMTLMFRQAD